MHANQEIIYLWSPCLQFGIRKAQLLTQLRSPPPPNWGRVAPTSRLGTQVGDRRSDRRSVCNGDWRLRRACRRCLGEGKWVGRSAQAWGQRRRCDGWLTVAHLLADSDIARSFQKADALGAAKVSGDLVCRPPGLPRWSGAEQHCDMSPPPPRPHAPKALGCARLLRTGTGEQGGMCPR